MAWKNIQVTFTGRGGEVPEDLKDQWEWLWKNYEFSYCDWTDLAGISDYRFAGRLIRRIIQLRLVFPDNTVAAWIERYIVLSAVHATTAKAKKKSDKPAEKTTGLPMELGDDEEEE
jgi:hypothetical protein